MTIGEVELTELEPQQAGVVAGTSRAEELPGFLGAAFGEVAAITLPGGRAARVEYRGDYAGIGAAYEAVQGWLADRGLTATGRPWEYYLTDPASRSPGP